MRSSCSKEDTAKKYASTSSSGAAKCTKTSTGADQYGQPWQQQRRNVNATSIEVPTDKSDKPTLKTVDSLALHHSIKPCQFTFLTAVKRKIALGGNHPTCKKTYESETNTEVSENKMELIKPLKVPDLKILPKADFSSCESLLSNEELAKKIEAVQRDEMALKSTDRVPRKLEFSSSSTPSMLNYENIEPLKIPDFTISKKKDLSRDSSREKENRTKRVKKDDFQNVSKWTKSQKHISRKDIAESVINRKLKNERILAYGPKECDINLKKPRTKSLATSASRKDEEKRYKLTNIPLAKSKSKTDSRASTSSSESLYTLDKGTRLHDKILIREGYKAMISEINDRKYKDDNQIVNAAKQSEDQKYKSHSESRLPKHQSKSNPLKPIETLTRDQNKRILDKQKSSNKTDSKHSSEISEDLTTAVSSVASLVKSQNMASETSASLSHEVDKSQSASNRVNEDPRYSDEFLPVSSSDHMSGSSIIETKLSQDSSLSERLMDPVRISFRDNSYSSQPEFADLVTPDINLTIRSKRRKALQDRDNDSDSKDSKQNSAKSNQDSEQTQSSTQQKTSINLVDSFSQSLQQAIDSGRSRLSSDDQKVSSKSTEVETADLKSHSKKVIQKPSIKVEVQTQTANDIATQTDVMLCQAFSRVNVDRREVSQISLDEHRHDGPDRIEDISIPNRVRTTSEISMYETTSSIKTETGTEISISTRDVTCSFNKYLDLEMAQLIKDERQRYDKIEMLFKSREKTLNDRTKKLIKLEEQKRALRDTGQDSRISSVKKKQRALLLKLQQEKDEMNRLKELHKIASQERKLMLQKQRDMFNPEMSTKNILNKLKRSADSQSPRRLSGPMKGYDIRSNSSISSLVDSDKSQLDRSHFDFKLNLSDISPEKNEQTCSRLEGDLSKQGLHCPDNDKKLSKVEINKQQKDSVATKLKYDIKARKFEEKMPKCDKLKQYDLDLVLRHGMNLSHDEEDKSISEHIKSESDAIIEEFTQVLKSQFPDIDSESLNLLEAPETIEAFKEMQRVSSSSKKFDKEPVRKLQQQQQHQYASGDNKNIKRKGLKGQKSKVPLPDSKTDDANSLDDVFRHHNKRSKIDSEQLSDDNYQNSMLEELDFNESQSSLQALLKHSNLLKERNQKLLQDINDERNHTAAENSESPLSQKDEEENVKPGNTSARSQLSLTISHQSSNDSDRSYSRSVVIRSQQDHHHHHHHQTTTGLKNSKKLEQILRAREATLVSRRNCVEEWIAWHARLREEENRVARMEQAAYKLVSATAKALSHNDTTVSSDTGDVEGRIELLTQKLADRRLEMARLKKEARKQAKQRLRALEANLLNQIKKYDATIRDMRKKLDAKKVSTKEIEKLAVESKSVIDFKVPEIPIKKIQEIYKSSDLLRSKSDSDILTARSEAAAKDDATRSNHTDKDLSRNKDSAEPTPVPSLYTINDELEQELSEKSDNSALHSYKTKSNSEEIATQKSLVTEREIQEIKRSSSQSSNISEEISSEAYSVKSQSEQVPVLKISEALTSQDVSEKMECGASTPIFKKDAKESLNIEEELSPDSDDTSLIFSRKLDHIQLHNKELNNDIHNLENDLKALTEMMSSFSKKTVDKKSRSLEHGQRSLRDIEKSTSKDISEELPATESHVQTNNLDKDLQARVEKILSDVVPETDDLVTSIEELDVRTKKVEVFYKAEKSQTPEGQNEVSMTEEISTHSPSHLIENSEALDAKIDSISEVVSTATSLDKENISPNESNDLAHKVLKSPNAISTELDKSRTLNTDKLSSIYVQNINTDVSLSQRSREISTSDQVVTAKTDTKEMVGNEIRTIFDDKNVENRTSTIEEVSSNHLLSSKTYQQEATENVETKISSDEKISVSKVISSKIDKEAAITNDKQMPVENECDEDKMSVAEEVNLETDNSFNKTAEADDWESSDSFDIQRFDEKDVKNVDLQHEQSTTSKKQDDEYQNGLSDIENSTLFIPRGESTNLQDSFVLKLNETGEQIGIRSEEFNDILEIIDRETKLEDNSITRAPAPAVLNLENEVDKSGAKDDLSIDVSVSVKTPDEESESIEEEIEENNEASYCDELSSEKALHSNNENLPQIEIDLKVKLDNESDEKVEESEVNVPAKLDDAQAVEAKEPVIEDKASSDGEQRDNLIEVAEGSLDTVEKSSILEEASVKNEVKDVGSDLSKTHVTVVLDKTFEVIKDPEYEDISEESLEVSEILDRSEVRSKRKSKKFSKIPEKYVIKSKSDEVLRILDELSSKSSTNFKEQSRDVSLEDKSDDLQAATEELSAEKQEALDTSAQEKVIKPSELPRSQANSPEAVSEDEVNVQVETKQAAEGEGSQVQQESPVKGAFESSDTDGMDTPSGISEIEADSPRTNNNDNSRLDVEALDDDLLSGNSLLIQTQENETKTEFTSEKDIKAMIHKLQASLEQPGIEFAAFEAKLLQIENLKIELEIKKLEAEEVSYYFREIPNKPPPPYTPPGAVRLSSSFHDSPSPPPSVVPTSVEELSTITDRISAYVYAAKQSGKIVPSLEAPPEVCELGVKEDGSENESLRKDRRIYNLFLFDLCKELVVDMYRSEDEKPGPSWTKLGAGANPGPREARTLDELSEYVSREVATLLGFKTKPQRENLVMRWSRKRRDRVDELLAKEAQAEEKEWTKYDYDELAVKNEMTMTMLNNLITETTKCVKAAYAKKRRLAEVVDITDQAQTAR